MRGLPGHTNTKLSAQRRYICPRGTVSRENETKRGTEKGEGWRRNKGEAEEILPQGRKNYLKQKEDRRGPQTNDSL